MGKRSEISPDTLRIALEPEGVEVEYLDDRSVFYHGVPEKTSGPVRAPPGTQVHVLVTDPTETEGVMIYVNDRKTADEILRNTGVGRVLVETDEERSIFPGVTVQRSGYQIEVASDPSAARGRVFVFAEDERAERSWEIVAASE
ncbi:DUF5796 family protein [Halocatena pleomorpha]|uniref:Uncharacterized protein n=1 Tax=Halocatena pleomorpha TaxID=1785090 RepID=A0A3P3RJU3_9EURY|nr:DUF5796 family protein [Halocatena pleomorpha]RRJ33604.1 hypothetical protein EIK79_02055 [Halocatena pleomorpha]